MPPAIEQFLGSVPQAEAARALRALCALILSAEPALAAEIKWNAPSFTLDGRDVVTTGVNRDGSIRLVLHRGAAKAAPGTQRPSIDDPDALLEWRGVDRDVRRRGRGARAFRGRARPRAAVGAVVTLPRNVILTLAEERWARCISACVA